MENDETIIGLYHDATQRIAFHTYLLAELDIDVFNLKADSKNCAMISKDLKDNTYNVIIKGVEIRLLCENYSAIVKSKDSIN